MAVIKLKHSETPSAAPSSLQVGEVAINSADGTFFWLDGETIRSVNFKNPTATTRAQSDDSGYVATTAFVHDAVDDVIGTAPSGLDTLGALAAAIANDTNFSATVSNLITNRLRVDAAQGLPGGNQTIGRNNLGLGDSATKNVGTGVGTVAAGDDSRFGQAASFFTTGDAKLTFKNTADAGWLLMDDGTFGNAGSGSSNRANVDCEDLFLFMFNFPGLATAALRNTWIPIYTSSGQAAQRSSWGSAAAAWSAAARIRLPRQMGRSLAVSGQGAGLSDFPLASFDGSETHTQTEAELAWHNHTVNVSETPANDYGFRMAATLYYDQSQFLGYTGSSQPMSILDPRAYWNVMIKL